MATLPCLQEVELIHLSRDIHHDKYSELCLALGFLYNQNQSILKKHLNNYIKAMEEILNKWNTEQADTNESRSILVKKLRDVELYEFEQKLSKGEYLPKQQDPHEQEATPLPRSSGIYSKEISASLTVQQCREKLENKYQTQLCKIQMTPWNQGDYAEFEDMHTVVTMVKKDARGKDTEQKETLQGSVAEIFSTKVNGKLPNRILISAPAGRGKTTAVAKMAYDWVHREKGSALEVLPLLFVVKFRNTSQFTSIGAAIKSQLLSDVVDLTPEGLESFIRENQGICHIILDGLDEYAGISSSIRSSHSNIVSVIRWEEFPECRVLVTTRPHLENFFNQDDLPRVYTKMWIEGFSRESSREYIDKFFASTSNPDSRDGHGLKVYLDGQPLIDELVKTPLFCLMVCHLWSEGLLDRDITTQTELLDSVNVFLMHHANARSKHVVKITLKMLRKIVSQLGEVALSGLLDDAKKLVFTPYDFRKVPAILERACKLGIVSQTTVYIKCLPQSNETTYTTIEFYHKLAQEHSAGKYLADQHRNSPFLLRWKTSKLDTLLNTIKANIGDYENLIRFAAGTDNSLCIRIMEALLSNSFLDESERYRIILDCSSETKGTEGKVSSLVQKCVNAKNIVLKATTVYTVVGMQHFPKQLKQQVRSVKFEGSTLTTSVTSGLWSCLQAFPMLNTLIISDSSLSFPPYPPKLPSVTKLSAEKVTSQSYEGLLSSIPGVRDIDVYIDAAETSNTFPNITTASRPMSQTRARDEQSFIHIRLHAWPSLTTDREIESGETIGGLSLLFRDHTGTQQRLHVSGVKGRDEEAFFDLFVKTKRQTSLTSGSGGGSLSDTDAAQNTRLDIQQSELSAEMTMKLWSYLRSFTRLNQLTISDSSLSFPPSPPGLPSVTKLSAEKLTSQSYEGVLSSIPGVRDIDVSIDVAEKITTASRSMSMSQTRGRDEHIFVHIRLHAWPALAIDRKIKAGETIGGLGLLIEDQAEDQQRLYVSGVTGRDEEALVDLFVKTKQLTYLNSGSGPGPLHKKSAVRNTRLEIKQCQLSTEMTEKLWSSLRSYTPLSQVTISDSSLSFLQSHPELPSVTKLSAEKVTSQSYVGVLSSIPGVRDIDVTIAVAETSNTFQITTTSRPIRQTSAGNEQFFVHVRLHAWPAPTTDRKIKSGETMGGLSLLIEDQGKDQHRLYVSGVKGRDEEALVDLFVKTKQLTYLNSGSGGGSLNKKNAVQNTTLEIDQCQLSTDMTEQLWSSLTSYTPLNHLTISDSSLSFPPSPPELPSVTKLSAERVTPQSYEGLLSSLPCLEEVDITIGDANKEDTYQIQTSLRRHLTEHDLTRINHHSFTSRGNVSGMSRKGGRGLGLLITECQAILSGVVSGPKETMIDIVQSSTRLMSASLYVEQLSSSLNYDQDALHIKMLTIKDCQLSTEMTVKLWSRLMIRPFYQLDHLTISDSSLRFPPSPSKLRHVTKLSVERVTSQSYEGLLSSLPGLTEMNITIDDAERDIPQMITGTKIRLLTIKDSQLSTEMTLKLWVCLRSFTSLNHLTISDSSLCFPPSPPELRQVTKLSVERVTSQSYEGLLSSLPGLTKMIITIDDTEREIPHIITGPKIGMLKIEDCQISTEMTVKLWSCLRSFTSLNHLTISDSSLRFPSFPPELPSVTNLSARRVTSQSYEGLLASLPGLININITIDDAEGDIPQIVAGLCRPGEQHLTHITIRAPSSLQSVMKSVSRETMRGLGLMIREQTKNLYQLELSQVKCVDEEDLVHLIGCCRRVKTLKCVRLYCCGSGQGSILQSYLQDLSTTIPGALSVEVRHDGFNSDWSTCYNISKTD